MFPIVNQGDVTQNFEIQFLKEAAKFVQDFKSLANEADDSLDKQKTLELEIDRLLRAIVSQDVMSIVQNTLNPLSQKLKNENMELEFQVLNYAKENAHLKTTYKNLIDPCKTFRKDKFVPLNNVRASVRTNLITVSQPHVITKKDVNSNSNGLFSTRVDITTKTRRPQPRSNTKNDRVPFASKSSWIKNKEVEVEEHHKNLLLSKNKKHMSSECNNVKLAIQNDKYKVVCAMCKQCLITANHDVCVLNYVNGMNSHGKKPKANVSNIPTHTKLKPKVRKPNKIGSKERLSSPNPRKPRTFLRWLLTGRIFDLKGKIIASSDSECQSDCSNGDNAYTSNPQEPLQSKGFQIPLLLLEVYPNLSMARWYGY
ncbi:hypothetical protein Tco_0844932 [Tanacetum coccineum]